MKFWPVRMLSCVGITALSFSIACGGGSSSSSSAPPPTPPSNNAGSVHVVVSDDATEDWATIGVKILSVSLVPQGGGTPVVVFTAPTNPPLINLVQLDQLGEIIGNTSVPAGTYTGATLTLSANPGDVTLVSSADPEAGFDIGPGTQVPAANIQIQGATGTTGSLIVPLTVHLAAPLAVSANSTNALDLEFDLRNPALIVEHYPAGASAPTWAVNFNGPIRHHPRPDLTKLVLRHIYGQVASVSVDNTAITIDRAFPVHPITSPETATVSTITVPILADSANGTIFYNLDSGNDTPTTIYNFQALASILPTQYVRVAARYQSGTLVATRILASSSFDKVWKNPEGHVLHVNTTTNIMHVTTEDGSATALAIGPNTSFYFQSSNTVIGTGTAFFDGLTSGGLPNLARGFKVNATIDPLSTSTPPVALSVEIDVARYDGKITLPNGTDFTYTRKFAMADGRGGKDDYSAVLNYISSGSANTDQQGNAVEGFYWWNFAFPTKADTSANSTSTPIQDFVAATGGSVNFGGEVGALPVLGLSQATWNDPAATSTWAADWTLLVPTLAPLGTVTTAFSTTGNNFTFTVPVPTGASVNTPAAQPVMVDLSTDTLIYQVDRQGGVITVSSQTLATAGGYLMPNVPVKVFGVPQSDGSIKAYTLFYYTHTASTR
jgi:hypothetical protein